MSTKQQAQTFDLLALAEIAKNAEHQAKLIEELEPKPWRRTRAQSDAHDNFRQLAAYCRRVLNLANS